MINVMINSGDDKLLVVTSDSIEFYSRIISKGCEKCYVFSHEGF